MSKLDIQARGLNHQGFATLLTASSNLIIQGMQGFRIAIYELELYNSTAQTLTFNNGDKPLEPVLDNFPAGAGFKHNLNRDEPRWVLDTGADFTLTAPTGKVRGYVKYRYIVEWLGRIG